MFKILPSMLFCVAQCTIWSLQIDVSWQQSIIFQTNFLDFFFFKIQSLHLKIQSLHLKIQSLHLKIQSLHLKIQSLHLKIQSLHLKIQSLHLKIQSLHHVSTCLYIMQSLHHVRTCLYIMHLVTHSNITENKFCLTKMKN